MRLRSGAEDEMSRRDALSIAHPPPLSNASKGAMTEFTPTAFQLKVAEHATYYEGIAAKQFFTDFNPLTVDWTTPVSWGNDPVTCKSDDMSEDSGCMMPLGVGLCARPPSRLPIAHPKHARSSRAAPLSWALDCSSPL